MAAHPAFEDLLRRLGRLEDAVESRRTPQLHRSTVEGGALTLRDVTGQQATGYVGEQYDGTFGAVTVAGPNPPKPAAPVVATRIGGIAVTVTGEFDQDQPWPRYPVVAPQDFKGYEIQVSDNPLFPLADTPQAGQLVKGPLLTSARGGTVFIDWPTAGVPLWVRVVARSHAGKASIASNIAGPVPSGKIGIADLAFDIDSIAGTTIFYGPTDPTTDPDNEVRTGDLWQKALAPNPAEPGVAQVELYRWNSLAWQKVTDQKITQAIADAIEAQEAADAAQETADAKSRTFVQPDRPTGLTGDDEGDVWIDTSPETLPDGSTVAGNVRNTWSWVAQIPAVPGVPGVPEQPFIPARTNLAINPSFENDAVGAVVPPSSPVGYSTFGTNVGTYTQAIIADSRSHGTKAFRIVGPSMTTATTSAIVVSQRVAAAPGDTFRFSAQAWVDVADTTKVVRLGAWWYDASGTLIGTAAQAVGVGTTGLQTLTIPSFGPAPAGTAQVRFDVWRRGAGTGATLTNADLNVDSVLIEKNVPAGAGTGFLVGTNPGQPYVPAVPAVPPVPAIPAHWDWVKRPITGSALRPKSVVARDVIATGTVSAGLLEALMVLANVIIAGDPEGFHARLSDQALGFYRPDVDGDEIPELIGSLGGAGSFLSLVNDDNQLVAAIDGNGGGNFQTVTVNGDLTVKGRTLDSYLGDAVQQSPGQFIASPPGTNGFTDYGPIRAEVGVAEVNGYLTAGRQYEIGLRWTGRCDTDDSVESVSTIRVSGPSAAGSDTAPAPLTTSPEVDSWLHSFHANGRWETLENTARYTATTTGRHRFLFAVSRGALGRTGNTASNIWVVTGRPVRLVITDLGAARANTGGFTQGGGTFQGAAAPPPPAPTLQEYYVDLAPAGWVTYGPTGAFRASNTAPNGEPGPSQGWAPGSGGSNKGHWWFPVPNITGTIIDMEFFCWATHWYWNSGGNGVFNMTWVGSPGPNYPDTGKGNKNVTGIPKPGGATWKLPGDWWEHFTTHPPGGLRADGIRCGPTANNLTEYGKFEGNTARLRIRYVQ